MLSPQDAGFMDPEASVICRALCRRGKIGHKIKHRALEGPVQAKDPKLKIQELHENTSGWPR